MSDKPENIFDRFAPEDIAQIPKGYTSPMSFETTTEAIRRRQREHRHWTSRLSRWIDRQLARLR